ncbi:MAG: hypothetical protein ACI8PZ_006535, partial [Myxococcota bacterium]
MLVLLFAACAIAPLTDEPARWSADEVPMGAAPGDLAVAPSGGVLGASLHIEVSGAQAYEEVVLLRGVSGLGDGPCPAFLGGACLELAGAV